MLQKIAAAERVTFFKQRFADIGKEIAEDAALLIASLTENHPYYAQQLAQLPWLRTERLCSVSVVREAHESLIAQFSLIFSAIVDETHTTQQVRFLKALLDGAGSLTATEVLKRYQIASATSVARSKEALLKKDILDKNGTAYSLQDPLFAYWLKHIYFKNWRV